MKSKGHDVLFVSRNKEMEHKLLELYGIPFLSRGKGKNGKLGKILYLIYADFKLSKIAWRFKTDLFLNFLHPYPSHVASLSNKTSLVFSDTEHAQLHHKLTVPYATKIFTPACYKLDLGSKQIRFKGYMELAYLHPKYFQPDPLVLNLLDVTTSDKFVIVRFVSWTAVHDFGHSGMTLESKRKAVFELSKFAKVFISAEGQLPSDLEGYRINIPFNKMHDALFYCSLLFGESGTMASEAAVLGTPAIFINSNQLGYLGDEEIRYGLVSNFTDSLKDQQRAIAKALEIIQEENSKERYQNMRNKLLVDCIDTTELMVNEVLKYDPKVLNGHQKITTDGMV
jgi:predicted glycosyltransferase